MSFVQLALVAALASIAALPAAAHTGVLATTGLAAGVLHPLIGSDHLLAAFAVGAWAMQRGEVAWRLPATFVGATGLGLALGGAETSGVVVELLVAISLLALGALILVRAELAFGIAALLVAAFGLSHGVAHGSETDVSLPYAVGVLLATALLHAAGARVVVTMTRIAAGGAVRWMGGAIAGVGAGLLLFA